MQLLPVLFGLVQARGGHEPQRGVVFGQNKRPPAGLQSRAIPLEDRFDALLDIAVQVGQHRARGQADQVVGVREPPDLVEIVDAPDEAAVPIPPGPEILHVQIAHGEGLGRAGLVLAHPRPDLRPAVVRCAQERKRRDAHLLVLELEILTNDAEVPRQPGFITIGGFVDVHGFTLPPPPVSASTSIRPTAKGRPVRNRCAPARLSSCRLPGWDSPAGMPPASS